MEGDARCLPKILDTISITKFKKFMEQTEKEFLSRIQKKTSFIFPEPIELKTTMQDFLEDDTNSKFYLGDKGVKFVTNEKNIKKRFTQINGEIAFVKRNQQSNWHGDFIFEGAEEFQDYDEFIFDVKKLKINIIYQIKFQAMF